MHVSQLHVQIDRVKQGEKPHRWYDPANIRPVDAVRITRDGVVGLTNVGEVLDVHHADHPHTRNRKRLNGVSVMSSRDYERLRSRFGERVIDGLAGETILIDSPTEFARADLHGTFIVETPSGPPLELAIYRAIKPCYEFSRYCLGRERDAAIDKEVRDAFAFLEDGGRGYYVVPKDDGVVVSGAGVEFVRSERRRGIAEAL